MLPRGHPVLRCRVKAAKAPTSAKEIGGFVLAGPAASASPAPRPWHPRNDLAAVLEGGAGGHGQTGLTYEGAGAGRCGLQVLQVVTSVRLDGVRGVVVVRDAAEPVEQLLGRQWAVTIHTLIVTDGPAGRDGGGSAGGPCSSGGRLRSSLSRTDNPVGRGRLGEPGAGQVHLHASPARLLVEGHARVVRHLWRDRLPRWEPGPRSWC